MNEERKYLEQMARRNNGVLMIDDVLQAAQDEDNILHRHFEWDDTEAAKQYYDNELARLKNPADAVFINRKREIND